MVVSPNVTVTPVVTVTVVIHSVVYSRFSVLTVPTSGVIPLVSVVREEDVVLIGAVDSESVFEEVDSSTGNVVSSLVILSVIVGNTVVDKFPADVSASNVVSVLVSVSVNKVVMDGVVSESVVDEET